MQSLELKVQDLPYEINEELKLLRTNLQFCGTDKRVLLFTSAFSGEGKSTIAQDLCRSFTELGKTVLLIDADMRNSRIMRTVEGSRPDRGLSHYLSNQCEVEEIIYNSNIKNLSIIVAGKVPPNPAELLSRKRMKDLIEIGKKYCDYVIIDCPPIGLVVDAAVVAPYCDGAVIVIQSGEVKYRLAQEVTAKLQNSGCPLLGVVINKADTTLSVYGKYGKYGKYGGRYDSKYGYAPEVKKDGKNK